MILRSLLPTLIFLLGSVATSLAIEVANFSNETNRRATFDSSFIGAGFDLSGVGRSTDGRWGSVIGDNYFLSANHFHPATGSTINFTDDNMGAPVSHSYTVGGGFRLGTTDLWLGYTNEFIDPSIARYGVANQNANNLADLGLGTSTLYMSGDLVSGSAGAVSDHILGTNQADSFYDELSFQFSTPGVSLPLGGTLPTTVNFNPPTGFENDMIILIENTPADDTPALFHEALLEGGDSGSPLFSVSGSDLIIQGTASLRLGGIPGNFIDTGAFFTNEPLELRDGSTYSYIGSYQDELNTAIANVPLPIPEPSSSSLIAIALGFSLQRRRR